MTFFSFYARKGVKKMVFNIALGDGLIKRAIEQTFYCYKLGSRQLMNLTNQPGETPNRTGMRVSSRCPLWRNSRGSGRN